MKRDLMDILACPVCKGELELSVEEENEQEEAQQQLEGPLHLRILTAATRRPEIDRGDVQNAKHPEGQHLSRKQEVQQVGVRAVEMNPLDLLMIYIEKTNLNFH